MKTYALAARQFAISTWIAAGVRPRTGPPITVDSFRPHDMDGAALVYVCAHGLPNQPHWYGDRMTTLASAAQVRLAKLGGAICYLAGCFGIGPMSDALLDAGAACVVADRDANWSGMFWPRGSNELGRLFVQELRRGSSAGEALDEVRRRYGERHTSPRDIELLDTVELVGDWTARMRGGG